MNRDIRCRRRHALAGLLAGLCMGVLATQANAGLQQSLEDLKARLIQVTDETRTNLATAQALHDKGDMAGYCIALRATLVSVTSKAETLHQINELIKDEPRLTDAQKQGIVEEETMARDGASGLTGQIHATCDGAASPLSLSDRMEQMKALDLVTQKHLQEGLDAMQAGDKVKGCAAIRLTVTDYETQLDLTIKLKAAVDAYTGMPAEVAVQVQYAIGSLEKQITDLKGYVASNCPAQ